MKIDDLKREMRARSVALNLSLESRLDRIMQGWLLVGGLACAVRIATSPANGQVGLQSLLPYALLILAPFASMVLAIRWFANSESMAQPTTRLAIVGRWRNVVPEEARCHPLFGTSGIMVSLLLGMLLNVPVRAAEYLVVMPALSGAVPSWLSMLQLLMTIDVVLLSSLYTIAFVAALRRVPLFPRLLATVWLFDILMQVAIAQFMGAGGGLPPSVAAGLHGLLDGNVTKVLISIGLWSPYLLLSRRVNVTYRSRVPA
jgi:hypothetical protein